MSRPWDHGTIIRSWVESPAGENRLRVLQTICGCLITGTLIGLLFFVFVSPFLDRDEEATWIFFGLGVFFSVSSALIAQFFWMNLAHGQKAGTAPELIVNQVMSQWIVVMALHEGACFLCGILFFVCESNLEKGLLLGLTLCLLSLMAFRFPTRGRLLHAMGGSH